MMKVLNEELIYLVLEVVNEVPEGYVVTYGDIANLIDRPKNSRLVGKILAMSNYYGEYPCHRVVNHQGMVAPHFKEQRELLLSENVTFRDELHVDLKKHRWKG